ncbi:MAG: TIGR02147 family protein [Proteobacteria bacterium]|nr:MAG: TIGR02147 family protein [Pseudomonadota bacterium]
MNFFTVESYQLILKEKLEENSTVRGYQSRLADAANCQPSHLSKILKGDVQITPEHALSFCRFWELSELETDYFLTLVNLDRANSSALKERLLSKLEELRATKQKTDLDRKKTKHRVYSVEEKLFYWSNWYCPAIREIVAISGFRSSQAIAEHFSLPLELVDSVLDRLNEMELISENEKGWYPLPSNFVKQSEDHFPALHGKELRNFSNRRTAEWKSDDFHHAEFAAVARKDIPQLNSAMKEAIQNLASSAKHTEADQLLCLSIDIFRV